MSVAASRSVARCHPLGYLVFNREAIIRAAFRAYVEVTLAYLDPRQCHPIPPDCGQTWTGDLQRGALAGDMTVAWNEAGVVGIVFESRWRSSASLESLPEGPVATNPDDVRSVVPDLPDELLPALEMACGLIDQRHHIETARVGFWLCGDRMGGTLFDTPIDEVWWWRLAKWGRIGRGRLLPAYSGHTEKITEDTFRAYAPFLAVVDAVVDRRLRGPTELLPDELATLFPVPIDMDVLVIGQRELRKVGITWPGSSEMT